MSSLERLACLLREQGGLMASLLLDTTEWEPGGLDARSPAQLAGSGPRAEGHREEYELLIDAIYEGYLLHYGEPRVVRAADADLGLLAGDQLYAIGLAQLVTLGDLPAVSELADVITLSALAQSAGERPLAEAIWRAGAKTVGWGSSDSYARAKDLAFAGDPEASVAMRTIANS
jgi:hypothetical protein